MSEDEWKAIYREAWAIYYTPEHMRTLLRRGAATGVNLGSLVKLLMTFSLSQRLENVHPLQWGIIRLRHPSERRPGLAAESAFWFWPRLTIEIAGKTAIALAALSRLAFQGVKISRDQNRLKYMDQALSRASDDDDDSLELLTQTSSAKQSAAHQKKIFNLTHGVG
jgi:hypothetical protein